MAHQLLSHLSIIDIDNLCAVLETARPPNIVRTATNALSSLYQRASWSCVQQPTRFDPISLDASAMEKLYKTLIDYTTSCVARLLQSYATGDMWSTVNISVPRQIAVKLTLLTHSTSPQAGASLHCAQSNLTGISIGNGENSPNSLPSDEESILKNYDETFADDYISRSQARQRFVTAALKRAPELLSLAPLSWRNDRFFQSSIRIFTVGPDRIVCAAYQLLSHRPDSCVRKLFCTWRTRTYHPPQLRLVPRLLLCEWIVIKLRGTPITLRIWRCT
ncbi:hypothetical protein PG993_011843 [Apiospora rasikravindrae]|uniref:Uncharacterized protein n=1 Tax=Apiospora rasikravindrae TaxID=990691 RepID=A0ABR1S0S0_9PEZI